MVARSERSGVIHVHWFQAKNLDDSTGGFLKMNARWNDLGIVDHPKIIGFKQVNNIPEIQMGDGSVMIIQQLTVTPVSKWMNGNAVIG